MNAFGGLDLSQVARDPSAIVSAVQNVVNDPRQIVQSVSLVTRFGAYTKNPWNPTETTPGGSQGEAAINSVGLAVMRLLEPKLVIMTAAGPVTVDLTP